MPRHIDPPISIAERGLKNYLAITKKQHNNNDYDNFTHFLSLKMPKRIMAKEFNVSPRTIYHWIEVYFKEPIA